MAPSDTSSTAELETRDSTLAPADRRDLLDLARTSIRRGLQTGSRPDFAALVPDHLSDEPRATFVTLDVEGELAGCLGNIEPIRPVGRDVAYNAYGAAFRDPRFPPLESDDLPRLEIHVSLLSPLDLLDVETREDVLDHVEPGVHGLMIEEGDHRGTFLPSVWQKCPDPVEFLQRLNLKADLPVNYWSADLDVYRYTVDAFDRESLEGVEA